MRRIKTDTTICYRTTEEHRSELEAVAEKEGRSMSSIIILMLEFGLKTYQKTGKLPLGTE
jgi:hypothetical protein